MASALITPPNLITFLDAMGVSYKVSFAAIDATVAQAQSLVGLIPTVLPGDIAQQMQWYPATNGITVPPGNPTNAAGISVNSAFGGGGAAGGVGGGSFGAGGGSLNRIGIYNSFKADLEMIRNQIRTYANLAGLADATTGKAVLSIGDFAAYFNNPLNPGGALNTIYYTPDFATLFWYAYGQGNPVVLASTYALPAATVFAPAGIVLAYEAVTGAGAGNLTPGTFPIANGYSPVTPTGGLVASVAITALNTATLTAGPTPTANGNNALAYITTPVNGTATITLTAPNQNAVSRTFTVVVSNALAGAQIAFTPTVPGDIMVGAPTAVATTGTATAGAFQVVSGLPNLDAYGNHIFIGGLPMAQGFAPLKTAQIKVTQNITGNGTVTIHAPNQAGTAATFTAVITGLVIGNTIDLTPATGGDRIHGNITAIDIPAGITAGAFQVLSNVERAY